MSLSFCFCKIITLLELSVVLNEIIRVAMFYRLESIVPTLAIVIFLICPKKDVYQNPCWGSECKDTKMVQVIPGM